MQYHVAIVLTSQFSFITKNIFKDEAGDCGLIGGSAAFIVGGSHAELGEFPWMALLGAKNGGETFWHCGGSLINKWFIIFLSLSENSQTFVAFTFPWVEESYIECEDHVFF